MFALGIQEKTCCITVTKKENQTNFISKQKTAVRACQGEQKFSMLKFNYGSIKSNEESLKFFTGLPTDKHFEWIIP